MRLDGRWFGKDSFRLTEEAINFNAMHILNSFIIKSLFSDLSYTIKGDNSNIEQIKKQTEVKSKLRSSIKLVC